MKDLTTMFGSRMCRVGTIQIRSAVLAFALTFIFSAAASAQVSMVHVTSCGPVTFPGSCTIPATGAGDLIVVGWEIGGGVSTSTVISAVTDNAGNRYVEAGAARAIDTAAGSVTDIWYAQNSLSGATSITITPNASISNGGAVIWEFSGMNTTAPLDQAAVLNSQAASSTPSGAAVSTTGVNEVVISLAAVAGDITGVAPGNSFTNDSALKGNGWAHLISTSAGAYAAQWNESPSGTYASSTASFKAASSGAISACDLNKDGVVDVVDGQLAVNMSLAIVPCTANIEGIDVCTADVVNRVVTAGLGEVCITGGSGSTAPHSVTLSWTASTSSGIIGYNVYQAVASNGPFTKLTPSLVTGTTFTDTTVLAGQTYYYVATAVNSSQVESAYSTQVQATVPTP